MPSTSASTSSATLELALVVDLDEGVEVERARLAQQLVELVGLQRGDDQQDRVGARGGGLVELVRVDDEVLAQHRQVRGRARRVQVVERAAEVERLGEDRQRGGAAALVGAARSSSTVEPSRIAPGRRRAALVLGDHRDAGPQQRLARTADPPGARRSPPRAAASGTGSRRRPTSSRVSSDDPIEHAHAGASSCVISTSASSARGRAAVVDRRLGRARRPPRACRRGRRRRSPRPR